MPKNQEKRISAIPEGNYNEDKDRAFFPASVGDERTLLYPLGAAEAAAKNHTDELVDSERDARQAADNVLQAAITTINSAIDIDAETDTDIESDEDSVRIKTEYTNIKTGEKWFEYAAVPTVSLSTSGFMDSAMFEAFGVMQRGLADLHSLVTGLPRTVVAAGLGTNPTQGELTAAFAAAVGGSPNANDRLVNIDDNTEWIFDNGGLWHFLSSADIDLATQTNPGFVQHSGLEGCIGYYVAGVGQVNGWSNLKAAVAANTANIASKIDEAPIDGRIYGRRNGVWQRIDLDVLNLFIDPRDNRIYRTVEMPDGRKWLAENLDYGGNGGVYYNNAANPPFAKAGRLYTHLQALAAVPAGWHLPSDSEWTALAIAAGGTGTHGETGTAGTALKANHTWNANPGTPTGTDNYGFSALAAGLGDISNVFTSVNTLGNWWTSTEYDSTTAYRYRMYHDYEFVSQYNSNKNYMFSVRCVED